MVFGPIWMPILIGWKCKHGQVDKKNSSPKMQFKNDNFFNINT
jgi:hypothetical protein